METRRKIPTWLLAGLIALVFVMLFLPMAGRYGITSPWELNRASKALDLATDPSQLWFDIHAVEGEGDVAPLSLWMAALGFKLAGPGEWAGRLPSILLLMAAVLFTFWVIRRLIGERAAYFSVVVMMAFPLTGITNFLIGGKGPVVSILAFSLGGIAAARWWCFRPGEGTFDRTLEREPLRWVTLGAGVAGLVAGYYAIGGLVGLLMPLAAAFFAGFIDGDWEYVIPSRARKRIASRGLMDAVFAGVVGLVFVVFAMIVVPALLSKEPEFDLMAGGTPRVGIVPTFDYYLAHVAYGLYPWSGYLPMALAALLIPQVLPTGKAGERPSSSPVRLFFLLANFMAFACYSFFAFRYGKEPYTALMPAAVAIGVLLYDLERADAGWRVVGFIGCAFVLLFFRDLHIYPESMSEAWAVTAMNDAFPARMISRPAQAATTLLFLAVTFLVFLQGSRELPGLSYLAISNGVRRSLGGWFGRKWLVGSFIIAIVWVLLFVNAILVLIADHMLETSGKVFFPFALYASLLKKASVALGFLPFVILACDLGFRFVYNAVAKARAYRLDMIMGATVFVAFYYAAAYLPSISWNLSPRSGIETYLEHAQEGEELIAFRTSGNMGRFYGGEPLDEVTSQPELFRVMEGDKRVFFYFKREEAPSLDLAYKEKAHDHIPIVDASSWRFLLAANKPIPGLEELNPIAKFVRLAPPEPMFKVYANLDNKVEYLGYDLETKHMGETPDGRRDVWAGALESITLTTYWHCTGRVNGSYKFFIHVDGFGLRLNGDHEVLDGRYPTRYWRPGDYLVDKYRMKVPIHFRPGNYSVFMGLFQGDNRLPQVSGPGQDNRILAGILKVK